MTISCQTGGNGALMRYSYQHKVVAIQAVFLTVGHAEDFGDMEHIQ